MKKYGGWQMEGTSLAKLYRGTQLTRNLLSLSRMSRINDRPEIFRMRFIFTVLVATKATEELVHAREFFPCCSSKSTSGAKNGSDVQGFGPVIVFIAAVQGIFKHNDMLRRWRV